MRIAIPNELVPYIRIRDGEIIFKKPVPYDLKQKFEAFKKEYEIIKSAREESK